MNIAILGGRFDPPHIWHYWTAQQILENVRGIDKETTTYTVDVANDLVKDTYNRYYWIIGSDVTSEFTRWRDYQKLTRLMQFLVFPRKDYPIKNLPPGFHRVEGN